MVKISWVQMWNDAVSLSVLFLSCFEKSLSFTLIFLKLWIGFYKPTSMKLWSFYSDFTDFEFKTFLSFLFFFLVPQGFIRIKQPSIS